MFAPAIAFVDLETTGATGLRDRITEIGIVRVADGEMVEEWSTLVDPQCSIPEDIRILTGITNEMVRGKPTFAELYWELRERLDGHLFVAHNARFDYGFLKHEFRRCGVPCEIAWLPCGHYTMGEFPFSALAGYRIVRFLRKLRE